MRKRTDLAFPMFEFERRLAGLRQRMMTRGVEVMLVTTPENLFYLTGYETQGLWYFAGLIVPLAGEPIMVTRHAEDTVVEWDSWVELRRPFQDNQDSMAVLADAFREFGHQAKRIGYERSSYFFRASEQDGLFGRLPSARFIDCSHIVEEGRVIKSELEIEMIRRAARASEGGMRAGIAAVKSGATEAEVAAEVYRGMLGAGGHYCSMQPFIVSGPRSFVSHATWRERTIERGDCVFFEVGGTVHRYNAPMMRTVIVGELDSDMREAEKLVLEAMAAAETAIKPGVATGAADAAARAVIAKNRFGATQYTRVGYSVGIACTPGWGEGHIIDIKPGDERLFQENMCFHLIPFLQIPGKAAVGISATIRVTASGCESLQTFERKLFVA
ncbi:MAG: Xaa-Pro peptidase family protein [Alphaproteobacteria bacterium]